MAAFASWALTFVFVLVTWVFFRSPDFGTAWTMLRRMAFLDTGGMAWAYTQAVVVLILGASVVASLRATRPSGLASAAVADEDEAVGGDGDRAGQAGRVG